MRQRLSWDQGKVAEISKQADPYTMNQDHKNNPVEKYDVGGPADFAETPSTKTPWKNEGRNEVGLPSPAAKAVQAARILEDKALKCITIAQRVLPGASDDLIEKQATDFMYMPDRAIIATLQRQAELAEVLAKECKTDDDEKEVEAKKAPVDEKEIPVPAEKEVEAKKAPVDEKEVPVPAEKEVEAKKAPVVVDEKEVPAEKEVEAKKAPVDEKDAPAKEEGMDMEASIDLLDQIFAESTPKTGAKKLSGIVKQASSINQGMSLDNLWNSPPDVSKAFR